MHTTLLHVEDDPLWGDVAAKILNGMAEIEYLGRAPTAADAVRVSLAKRPAIVIVDLILPDGGGFELACHLVRMISPSPAILFLTVRIDEATLFRSCAPFVSGLVWKTTFLPESLQHAVQAVLRGAKYFPPDVRQAIAVFRRNPEAFYKILSDREIAILPSIASGETDAEIGHDAGLSPLTIKSHRHRIMKKLNLKGSLHLIRWALQKGFGRPFGG